MWVQTLYRFNLEAGKAAALGHTWSGATHVPGLGRKGGNEGKKKDEKNEKNTEPIGAKEG